MIQKFKNFKKINESKEEILKNFTKEIDSISEDLDKIWEDLLNFKLKEVIFFDYEKWSNKLESVENNFKKEVLNINKITRDISKDKWNEEYENLDLEVENYSSEISKKINTLDTLIDNIHLLFKNKDKSNLNIEEFIV